MTKDEILKLHELSDDEQKAKLKKDSTLKITGMSDGHFTAYRLESLADCAFRLRDESNLYRFDDAFYEIGKLIVGEDNEQSEIWEYIAKPIHWIQAALLAKEGKE